MGLCTGPVMLDGGGTYRPSRLQKKVASNWKEFCTEWVPRVTKKEPFILVFNGDALDGVHHNSTTQISHNLDDQSRIAKAALGPLVEAASAVYWIRGTEAHVGKSGVEEERLARELGAIPDEDGAYARWNLWLDLGGHLCHFTHHIGTTGSSSYESTAIWKEMVEAFVEAGRWGERPPQVIVRSHRHRYGEVRMYGKQGLQISTVSPGWQLPTPFVWRLPGARISPPQFGGLMVRAGDEELHTRAMVWTLERGGVVSVGDST